MSLMTALIRGGRRGGLAAGTRTRPLGGSVEPLFCGTGAIHLYPTQGQLSLPHLLTQAPVQFQRVPLTQWVKPFPE